MDQDKITALVAKVTGIAVADLTAKSDQTDLWDSFKQIEIILVLEEELGRAFAPDDIAQMKCLRHIWDACA